MTYYVFRIQIWIRRIQMFLDHSEPHPDPVDRVADPRIRNRSRLRTKMSRIHNTVFQRNCRACGSPPVFILLKILNPSGTKKQAVFCIHKLLSFSEEVYYLCHEKSLEDEFDPYKTGNCINLPVFYHNARRIRIESATLILYRITCSHKFNLTI
jgi:hypothetical protein